ncbi:MULTISPECIES: 5'-3' exonuclease [unclassified Cryobacterium]|uniref:5'-3' exonuclease n=1 Tax=unclassified Cryobacterium TaxID=2649013 RepID=UPI00106C9719|nr:MULTISPECIES: 5'-3' exonuclease [unclassified Cryobacterium]TFC54752.1 5'-3' exonuclease [Cryobacterium sp. TMB3-1-2]TFC58291.1 5'-3' exonuclease [Cryobacterium sp. TMB1-7]TFC71557.1 5'-3' exonuclease [Cryobacterium sp. TMB3-15]TFC72367.1 5'-3' exonuclease [Cryobacterium sp. TMB3-10]TFD42532.1 5'-3' exonuclease [Cryobacterium sp. TMB3-12]
MLLDTASLYFRAFYGVPDLVRAPTGEPVNAVRGLLDMIARLATEFQPTEIVACWDDDWRPQWRVDLIPTYKTHRVAAESSVAADPAIEVVPDLLTPQVPIIREVLTALGIPIIGAAQHEADDVIGTLASHSSIPVDIITGDRDLFQLVDDTRDVRVIYTGRGMARLELLTDATLTAKTGVTPAQYADFAAMRGDASDGLPGVAGVGEKTAATLLAEYGDLDGIVAAAADPDVKLGASVRARILAAADYLTVAPTVVNVVRDLDLPDFDARIRPSTPEQNAELEQLSATWGLSSSMQRAREALAALV